MIVFCLIVSFLNILVLVNGGFAMVLM